MASVGRTRWGSFASPRRARIALPRLAGGITVSEGGLPVKTGMIQRGTSVLTAAVLAAVLGALLLTSGCDTDEASLPTGMGACGYVIESLTATPAAVAVGDSAMVCARVVKREGAQPVEGVAVSFGRSGATAGGSFTETSAETDEDGYVCMAYRPAAIEVGGVDLKASVGDCAYKYVTLVVLESGSSDSGPLSVQITGLGSAIPADGTSTLDLTVSVKRDGLPAANETVILAAGERFNDVDHNGVYSDADQLLTDDGDGLWDAIGTIAASATTDSNGEAEVIYTAGSEESTLFIKATVDTVSADYEVYLHAIESNIEVSVTPAELLADGLSSAIVTAVVSDAGGDPLNGKLVRFTAGEPFTDADGDGYYTNGESFTDENENGVWDVNGQITSTGTTTESGAVAVLYVAGRTPGEVTIYASTQEERASTTLELLDLPPVVSSTYVWTPATIYADGSSQSELRLTLYDINGGRVSGKDVTLAAGEPFTDNNGNGRFDDGVDTLGQEIIANGIWDAIGDLVSAATSDASGVVTVSYTAGTTPGTIYVKATTAQWSTDVPLTVAALPTVISIEPAADHEEIVAKGVTGQDWTTIRALCYGDGGQPVPAGVPVLFEVSSSPGGGVGFSPGGLSYVTGYTNDEGEAQAVLLSGSVPGMVAIHVSSGSASASLSVEILSDGTIRQIMLEADPGQLTVQGVGSGDHAVIRAACYLDLAASIAAPAGFLVDFEILSGPGGGEELLGEHSGLDVPTDEHGVASVVLRAGTVSGPVTLRASAGDATQTLYLGVAAGPPAGCFWTPTPPSIPFGGKIEEELGVMVYDAHHNPVPDETIVVFGANTGLIRGDGGQGSEPTINGLAACDYFAPTAGEDVPSVAILYAEVDGAGGVAVACSTYIDLPLLDPSDTPGPIAYMSIQTTLGEIEVIETGGQEQCQIVATCFDESNRLVGSDREVTFEIVAGPGGGESLFDAGWGPLTVLTDEASMATVTLISGTKSGTVQVQASAEESEATKSSVVSISAGPPAYVSVGVDPQNIRGWDVVGAEASILAIVSDQYNNPVRDNTVVYFTVDEGIVRGYYEVQQVLGSCQTFGGMARGTYFSGLPRDDGDVILTASTSGGSVIGTDIFLSSGPPASVTFLTPAPPPAPAPTLWADGESELQMWVEVLDVNDNFVLAGTRVEWRTDVGMVTESSTTADGVYGSVATSDYLSEVLDEDYSWTNPDDGIGAVAHVTAAAGLAGGANDLLEIYLLTSNAARSKSSIEFESTTVSLGASVPFEVIVKDRFGNPLGGHQLAIAVTDGTVTATAITDRWGTAGNLYFNAPDVEGTVYLTVTDMDPGYGGITLSEELTVE